MNVTFNLCKKKSVLIIILLIYTLPLLTHSKSKDIVGRENIISRIFAIDSISFQIYEISALTMANDEETFQKAAACLRLIVNH